MAVNVRSPELPLLESEDWEEKDTRETDSTAAVLRLGNNCCLVYESHDFVPPVRLLDSTVACEYTIASGVEKLAYIRSATALAKATRLTVGIADGELLGLALVGRLVGMCVVGVAVGAAEGGVDGVPVVGLGVGTPGT